MCVIFLIISCLFGEPQITVLLCPLVDSIYKEILFRGLVCPPLLGQLLYILLVLLLDLTAEFPILLYPLSLFFFKKGLDLLNTSRSHIFWCTCY